MPDLQLPSFSTFEKLYGWFTEQMAIFVRVLGSQSNYYSESVATTDNPTLPSISFFAFVILLLFIVNGPIDTALWKVPIFDASIALSTFVPLIFAVILFILLVYWSAKFLGGKGDLRHSFAGLIYSSAFMPFLYATHLITQLDPEYRKVILNGKFTADMFQNVSPLSMIGSVLEVACLIWIIAKLVPLIRIIHSLSTFKAFIAVAFGGIGEQLYEYFVGCRFGLRSSM